MKEVVDNITSRLTPVEGWNEEQRAAGQKLIKLGGNYAHDWCMKAIASSYADAQMSAIKHHGEPGRKDTGYDILKTAMDNTLKYPDYQSAHDQGG